jgi:hypothetical protein
MFVEECRPRVDLIILNGKGRADAQVEELVLPSS